MYIHGSASVLAVMGDIDVPWGTSGYHFQQQQHQDMMTMMVQIHNLLPAWFV